MVVAELVEWIVLVIAWIGAGPVSAVAFMEALIAFARERGVWVIVPMIFLAIVTVVLWPISWLAYAIYRACKLGRRLPGAVLEWFFHFGTELGQKL
jgi:hypothetical protein